MEGERLPSPTNNKSLSRRDFIKVATISTTGLVIAACAPGATPTPVATPRPTPTPTATPRPTPAPTPTPTATPRPTPTPTPTPPPAPPPLQFFNASQVAVVEAATARIMPSDASGPGAKEAGVVYFIDQALAGYDASLQDNYIRGLEAMDRYSNSKFGKSFVRLEPAQQDEVLTDMQTAKATDFTTPSAASFFGTLRTHTMFGTFSDPSYGGNRDMVGWKLLGFPGAVFGYSPEEFNTCAPVTRGPVSLA